MKTINKLPDESEAFCGEFGDGIQGSFDHYEGRNVKWIMIVRNM